MIQKILLHKFSNFSKRNGLSGLLLVILVSLAGCKSAILRDPNDPNSVGVNQANVLEQDLKNASDSINVHVRKNLMSSKEGQIELQKYAGKLLDSVHQLVVFPNTAWKDADVMITAKRWADAASVLKIALAHPASEDRWVNDTLRLAHCDASLGKIPQAIALTKSTFKATPKWKWPVLYATYLQIVPAALAHSHGDQLELAQLVKGAIHQHELAWGTMSKPKYVGWLEARQIQIDRAWAYVIKIYLSIGRKDLARQAIKQQSQSVPPVVSA